MADTTNNRMYDTLLQLPLFQGLSSIDMTRILERVRMEFVSIKDAMVLAHQGSPCDRLIFLLKGEIIARYTDDEHELTLTWPLHNAQALEIWAMYGKHTTFHNTYKAMPGSHVLMIDKRYVLDELLTYRIIQLNMLNTLCSHVQRMTDNAVKTDYGYDLRHRFGLFISRLCLFSAHEASIRTHMNNLAQCLGATRLNLSRLLHVLEQENILTLSRGLIHINNIQRI